MTTIPSRGEEDNASRDLSWTDGGVREPEYLRQSGDVMTDVQAAAWYRAAALEARAEGITHARFSYHPDIPHLRIVEGWLERPADEGAVRWALTVADTSERSVPAREDQP